MAITVPAIGAVDSEVRTLASQALSVETSTDLRISTASSTDSSATASLDTRVSAGLSVDVSSTASLDTRVSSLTSTDLSSTASLDTRVSAGLSVDVSATTSLDTRVSTGLSVDVSSTASIDTRFAAGLTLQKRTVTVGHADLTNAVNGAADTINIGAVLPANARILGAAIHTVTAFSGAGATSVAVDIGTAGDVDAIVDGADLFTAAVDGQAATLPAGIAPNKLVGAAQLISTWTPDGAHTLAGLDAGSAIIDVLFVELA